MSPSYIPPDLPPNFNQTLLHNKDLCTLQTCPLSLANFTYIPNLFGNALYTGIFGLILISQIGLTIKYRSTWGYGIAMVFGLALEVVGYIARIQMHQNPFPSDPFLMYLVCLTIAPAFLSAAIYLCLSRIVIVYSEHISRFKPATYTFLFVTCDFISLLLQAAGGGLASAGKTESIKNKGKDIMVAGVSWQVASLSLFALLCYDFYRRVHRTPESQRNLVFATFRTTKKFIYFLWALAIATVTIFARSVFRCAELSGGFHGPLANEEITFMILEGAMICIAVIAMTVFHPGLVFGANWDRAAWKARAGSKTSPAAAAALGGNYTLVDAQAFKTANVEETQSLTHSSRPQTPPEMYPYSAHPLRRADRET